MVAYNNSQGSEGVTSMGEGPMASRAGHIELLLA